MKFEYTNYYIDTRRMRYKSLDGKEMGNLNDLGKQGWQLTGISQNSYDSHYPHVGVFVREINTISIGVDLEMPTHDSDFCIESDDDIPDIHPGTW